MATPSPECDVVVIGGGPAGTATATKLARFGLDVVLFEKGEGRRQHTGESLPSSIRVVLDALGLELPPEVVVERPPEHRVYWGDMQGARTRDAGEASFLVWRGAFDEALRAHARRSGVRLEKSAALRVRRVPDGHDIADRSGRRTRCRFLVDASGRAGVVARRYRRRERGYRTLAMTAHFRTGETDPPTLIEAFPDGWIWSAPLANGLRDVTVMLDERRPFDEALDAASNVRSLVGNAARVGRLRGIDATPYRASRFCDSDVLLVGDAGSFLDPLSAHGVHKALDGGIVAAIVARTILERPALAADAARFFDEREQAIYRATRERIGRLYAHETRFAARPFWRKRAATAPPDREVAIRAPLRPETKLRPGLGVTATEAPVLEGDFIERRRVLSAPEQERPVRFLGSISLPEVFDAAVRASDAAAAARASGHPFDPAYRAIDWLYRTGYLDEAEVVE